MLVARTDLVILYTSIVVIFGDEGNMQGVLRQDDLEQFTGTSKCHPVSGCSFVITDGVKFLMQRGNAGWLVDRICLFQRDLLSNPRKQGYQEVLQGCQVWRLWVNPDRSASLSCSSGDSVSLPSPNCVVFAEDIPSTDFPLEEIELFLSDRVLSLPNEYPLIT
jgi:hypothetical protein